MAKNLTFWTFMALGTVSGLLIGCNRNDNKVIARVGSIKITTNDLAQELENSPPAYQTYLSTLEGKKQFVDILLREKILLQAAKKSGVSRKKEIKKNLKEYKERKKLEEAEYRKNLILREYLRELKDSELKITEPEIKNYYDANEKDFVRPVKITASHILSPTSEEAEKALKRIKKGEDFSKVAQEISTDPSAVRGGKIGDVSKGDLSDLPEFEEKLFSMKSGKVSDVVKTKIGFHIIKKNGEIRLPTQSFEQAAPQIHRILEKKKFDEWNDKTKKDRNAWIDEKTLASLSISHTTPEPEEKQP